MVVIRVLIFISCKMGPWVIVMHLFGTGDKYCFLTEMTGQRNNVHLFIYETVLIHGY